MRAGELDQQIIIQIPVPARGNSGEETYTWQTWKTVWASVKTSAGAEKYYSPQMVAESTHKLKLRYLQNVNTKMRILWRGHVLDIVHIDDSRSRQGELYLLCKEMV